MFSDTWFAILTFCCIAWANTWFAILTLCCIAWASWVFISILRRVNPPLPPGPLGLPVVGSLPFLDPELHTYFASLTKTYGPLVTLRLGKKIGIVVGSASMAKQILKEHDVTFANRDVPAAGREATYGGVDIGCYFLTVCVREMLSSATLNAMYGLRKHEISQTMQSLKERSGSAVNIGDEMFITAMNVVTSMLWGATVKGEERAEFQAVVLEITSLLGVPNVSDFFPALKRFDLQGIVKKTKECVKKLDGIYEEAIERRGKMEASGESETKDFLQVLLDLKDSNHGDSKVPFTMLHLKALFMVN
ncbi:hypothetical protein V2J09_010353 [Rumex salicifolius]